MVVLKPFVALERKNPIGMTSIHINSNKNPNR